MDGQTFAIAGLMNNTMNSTLQKIPGIGDIPILGHLFRSKAAQKNQTELVVMITPQILRQRFTGGHRGAAADGGTVSARVASGPVASRRRRRRSRDDAFRHDQAGGVDMARLVGSILTEDDACRTQIAAMLRGASTPVSLGGDAAGPDASPADLVIVDARRDVGRAMAAVERVRLASPAVAIFVVARRGGAGAHPARDAGGRQ